MQWQKIIVKDEGREVEVQISVEKENVYRIRINGREYIVEITRKSYTISRSSPFNITLQEPIGSFITAEIPGKVVDILVKEGDHVNEGDVVAVLESMKMEIEVTSPRKGIVKKVFVSKGSFVNVGDPLIEIGEKNQ